MPRLHRIGAAIVLALGVGVSAQRGGALAIPNLAGKVLTVLGPIEPATLGPTLMHEHIFIDFKAPESVGSWAPLQRAQPPQAQAGQGRQGAGAVQQGGRVGGRGTPGWNLLDNYDESLAEVMEFKKVGGGTIVDVTNFGLSRNPGWLKRISEASGLHVVMGSGWYQKALHPPDMTDRTVDELTDIIVRDIVVGAQGTNIKSGIVGEAECGNIGHYIIRAARNKTLKSSILQRFDNIIPARPIFLGQMLVVLVGLPEGIHPCLL